VAEQAEIAELMARLALVKKGFHLHRRGCFLGGSHFLLYATPAGSVCTMPVSADGSLLASLAQSAIAKMM
jgi:hypothetical protein